MVNRRVLLTAVVLGLPILGWSQAVAPAPTVAPAPVDGPSSEAKGPTLYGDGNGGLWKWADGEKTFLTPEGGHLSLGGVGATELWGWSTEAGQVRLFTLELPKKDDKKEDPKGTAGEPASTSKLAPDKKSGPPAKPVFDKETYPAADKLDRVGDRTLLVYGATTGQPRVEVYQAGRPLVLRAWDDGRLVYAAALGPTGYLVAGRLNDGTPWLEVNGQPVDAPEGWRGRLTVAAWAPAEEKGPVEPLAAGWGAPGAEVPRALFWGPLSWTQPDPADEPPSAGVYPVVGAGAQAGLALGGWRADPGTGVLRPWFWDSGAETVADRAADGQPVCLVSGKSGLSLVVRHQSAPWFTLEGVQDSTPLGGLGPDDHVVGAEGKGEEPPKGP